MTADVAQYYQHYIQAKQLQDSFVSGTVITSVRRLGQPPGREEQACADRAALTQTSDNPSTSLFDVSGYSVTEAGSQKPFSICTENVVLATGTYDSPAWLGIGGEDLPFVHHTTSEVETVIKEYQRAASSDPILIVGAGLTAADAVIAARHSNVPVIHVFRREVNDPGLIFNQLPKLMYPEYHKVHQMMVQQACTSIGPYNGYLSLPRHQVLHFTHGKKCVLQDLASGGTWTANIFMALVLIGSEPNLAFLPDGGRSLAVKPELPVSTRRNPIDVDRYTYECTRERGMYALGPLVADNFVRFLQGGALAITSALSKARAHTDIQSASSL